MTSPSNATGYEPLNTLKPVAESVWLIDGAALRFCGVPFPTRCTVVRLKDGTLWVHGPTKLSQSLRAELDALGAVKHLIVANPLHSAHLHDWQQGFPAATTYTTADIAAQAARKGRALAFGHMLGPEAAAPWQGQIAQMLINGSGRRCEAVFLHHASATLIVTKLIENFETAKLPAWARPLIWLAGIDDSDGKMSPAMRLAFRKATLLSALQQMIAWEPQRMILAHGRWYERDAVDELRRAFRRILHNSEWSAALEKIKADQPPPS